MSAMEAQLKNVPSKNDLGAIVTEIRGVRETVIRNTDRIDSLFDLRKDDEKVLAKRVERIVEGKMAETASQTPIAKGGTSSNEERFLSSRRSIRIWPVENTGGGLEKAARYFFKSVLKIPDQVSDGLSIETVETVSQTRRSKVQGEVLVRFNSSQQRDVVQSYAFNLSEVQGKAGIRLDVPDFLRGLFRQFEIHAANLKQRYGSIKRAIRFDDVERSLYMDVKLQDTEWHRISADEVRRIRPKAMTSATPSNSSAERGAEKKKILLQGGQDPFTVPEEEANSSGSEYQDASK